VNSQTLANLARALEANKSWLTEKRNIQD